MSDETVCADGKALSSMQTTKSSSCVHSNFGVIMARDDETRRGAHIRGRVDKLVGQHSFVPSFKERHRVTREIKVIGRWREMRTLHGLKARSRKAERIFTREEALIITQGQGREENKGWVEEELHTLIGAAVEIVDLGDVESAREQVLNVLLLGGERWLAVGLVAVGQDLRELFRRHLFTTVQAGLQIQLALNVFKVKDLGGSLATLHHKHGRGEATAVREQHDTASVLRG